MMHWNLLRKQCGKMNVRKKVKVGDVFFLPITPNLFGIGWITCKCEGTFLCEFFEPIIDKSNYNNEIHLGNALFATWIYSSGLKAGIEEPHAYYNVPDDYEFPYFASSYTPSRGTLYVSQATENPCRYLKKRIVTEEEARAFTLEGIALTYWSVIRAYERRLRERNLFVDELKNIPSIE